MSQDFPSAPAPIPPVSGQPIYEKAKTNTFAIVALVTSFFVSVLGIIFGFIALSQIKKTGESGHGLALAGIIIGFVGVAVGIIYAIVIVALVATAGASLSSLAG